MIRMERIGLAATLLLISTQAGASVGQAPDVAKIWNQWPQPPINIMQSPTSGRTLASSRGQRITGSEDLMSLELKKFRDRLLACRDPETLAALLKEYDEGYSETNPADLNYVVARISPLRSLRGIIWRMAPLVHQAAITQEALLGIIRNMAEQVMIFEPDTQWEAYMGFITIPDARLVETITRESPNKCQKEYPNRAFCVENDLPEFMSEEIYPKFQKACERLMALKMTVTTDGREHPVVFDNRIRFGQNAFGDWNYAAADRFKIVGDGERYSAIARFQRRMAMIAQLAAYDWNGNIALRKELGTHIGIADSASLLNFGAVSNAYNLEGMTREERVTISRKHKDVFKLRFKQWMPVAYADLHNYAYYTAKAWQIIRNESDENNYLLDPEVFQGRKDQIDKSVTNLLKMLPDPNPKDPKDPKKAPKKVGETVVLNGAITGKPVHLNVYAFFMDPPTDLHNLLPTGFSHHEDIKGLGQIYQGFSTSDGDSVVSMKVADKPVNWRNYLYGRAVAWDGSPKSDYAKLYPGENDIAEAQRTLAETRGGRPLMNSIGLFVK